MAYQRLKLEEREELYRLLIEKKSIQEISLILGRHRSSIYREIKRLKEKEAYRPSLANQDANQKASSRKKGCYKFDRALLSLVLYRLVKLRWSPEQISARLKQAYPEERTKNISHESIYKYIYNNIEGAIYRFLRRKKKKRGWKSARHKRWGAIQDG